MSDVCTTPRGQSIYLSVAMCSVRPTCVTGVCVYISFDSIWISNRIMIMCIICYHAETDRKAKTHCVRKDVFALKNDSVRPHVRHTVAELM